MKFVAIFGPPAVGKMTVGQELAKLTGLKLFHNHMTIESGLSSSNSMIRGLGNWFRNSAKEFSRKSQRSELPGLIFTFVWALDHETDKDFIDRSCEIFRQKGAEVYFVELAGRFTGATDTKRVRSQVVSQTIET